jgi:predicted tellurium resistance membrane protein TerC
MTEILSLLADPAAWAALVTLVVMEVVLGIDNLVFISILSNKLPPEHRQRVRRIGISLALIMRLVLLSTIAFIVGLTAPVFDLGIAGPVGSHGEPGFETAFSWRDLILIAGGAFLIWKATKEIHHTVDPDHSDDMLEKDKASVVISNVGAAIFQIILLDLVFSIDSILTAVGMTDHLPIMVAAVVIAVTVMLLAADPLADRRDAGAGLPADDRHRADRRGLRRPRAEGLHLHRHGLLGRGRGPEHDGPETRRQEKRIGGTPRYVLSLGRDSRTSPAVTLPRPR